MAPMPARLTAHVPDRPASVRLLADGAALSVGRDPECELCLDHPSVSRRHASIEPGADGWTLRDPGSKNGSFVDGERAAPGHALPGDCWLRFGDVYCEFERLSHEQADALQQRIQLRRQGSAAMLKHATAQRDFESMLRETLRSAVELAGCERGFLLLGSTGELAVRAAIGLDPGSLGTEEFSGSVGAVRRAMEDRQAVVASDVAALPWLGGRASVVAGGIRALACAPILGAGAGAPVLGAVYADRVGSQARITELDLELFSAFVERMSLAIEARRAGEDLGALSADALRWEQLLATAGAGA